MSRQIPPAPENPASRNGLHTTTIVLSLVLHLVGFGAALGLPRLLPRKPPGAPIYIVDLVSLPPGGPAKPARSGQSKRPAIKPPARKQVAPQPPKPKPKPPPRKKKPVTIPDRKIEPEPATKKPPVKKTPVRPPEPTPQAGASGATADDAIEDAPDAAPKAGVSGGVGVNLGGDGSGGSGANDQYTFYLSLLDRNIRRTWTQPIHIGRDVLSAMVSLTLSSSGRVLRLDLVKPSGYDPLDRSVIRAVREASPFPPFPHFLGRDDLTVQIVFDLNPKGFEASPSGD